MSQNNLSWITGYIWGIADMVTCKLDVREAAANLPEVAEEPEEFEDLTENGNDQQSDMDFVPEEAAA